MTAKSSAPPFVLAAVNGEQQCPVEKELLVGRDPNSDVVLGQEKASRKHAQLTPQADGVLVTDLGSTNGTFVNDQRISEPTVLKPGDQLRCGNTLFVLQEPPQPAADNPDPDATMLYSADSAAESPAEPPAPAAEPAPSTKPEAAKPAPEKADADADSEPASQTPPSWVLQNQQSVDGTAFISKDMLKDSLKNAGDEVQPKDEVDEPTLVGTSEPVMGVRFQLLADEKSQWEIGRAVKADIMMNDESVSGSHAQILHENGRWKLVDLMSANGTYANGKKCLSGYLSHADRLRFGNVECTFLLPAGAAQETPTAESDADSVVQATSDKKAMKTALLAFGATVAVAVIVLLLLELVF